MLRRDDTPVSGVAIGLMTLTGGALVAFAPVAIVFPAVAVMSAAVRWQIQVAAAVAVAGWLAMIVAEVAVGPTLGVILGCLAGILGGALIGIARRQAVERTEQVARTEVETVRAEVERERAELLSERNHLAREIHDVLADTLAALSLQLEAFDTVVAPSRKRALPSGNSWSGPAGWSTRASKRPGRGQSPPGRRQSAGRAVEKAVCPAPRRVRCFGTAGPLSPRAVVGLYRVTQEALTNVMKHATGVPTSPRLTYADESVSVVIDNVSAPGSVALQDSGGGYGLQGIAERLALLGGRVDVGPTPGVGRWRRALSPPPPWPTRGDGTR